MLTNFLNMAYQIDNDQFWIGSYLLISVYRENILISIPLAYGLVTNKIVPILTDFFFNSDSIIDKNT